MGVIFTEDEIIEKMLKLKELSNAQLFTHKCFGNECFTGNAIIPHMKTLLGTNDTDQCVHFGNILLNKKYIIHVTHEHQFCDNQDMIYCFNKNWKVNRLRNQWMQLESQQQQQQQQQKQNWKQSSTTKPIDENLLQQQFINDVRDLEKSVENKERVGRKSIDEIIAHTNIQRKRAAAVFLPGKFNRPSSNIPPSPGRSTVKPIDPTLKLSIRTSLNKFTEVEQNSKIPTPRLSHSPAVPVEAQTDEEVIEAKRYLLDGQTNSMSGDLTNKRHSSFIHSPVQTNSPHLPTTGNKFAFSFTSLFDKIGTLMTRSKTQPGISNNDMDDTQSDEDSFDEEERELSFVQKDVKPLDLLVLQELKIKENEASRGKQLTPDDKFLARLSYRRISRKCSLLRVLHDDPMRSKFKEFARAELSEENVIFWELLETHYKLLAKEEDRKGFASGLYKLFISNSSPYYLNLPSHVYSQVSNSYNDGSRQAFFYAQLSVEETMQDTFKRYKATAAYKNWIQSVNNTST